MGLRDRLKEKSAALVQRSTITLPKTGEKVVVRGITTGAAERANAAPKDQVAIAIIAFCTEDPEKPGAPLFNYNDLNDRAEIANLDQNDAAAILKEYTKLSGTEESDAELLGNSDGAENSSISSPPATGFLPPNFPAESHSEST